MTFWWGECTFQMISQVQLSLSLKQPVVMFSLETANGPRVATPMHALDVGTSEASLPDAVALKDILANLANPDSLKKSPILRSWIVLGYRESHPESANYSAEFAIGQALEAQLEQWGKGYRLDPTYVSEWKEIFCLKAAYFHTKPVSTPTRSARNCPKLAASWPILRNGRDWFPVAKPRPTICWMHPTCESSGMPSTRRGARHPGRRPSPKCSNELPRTLQTGSTSDRRKSSPSPCPARNRNSCC